MPIFASTATAVFVILMALAVPPKAFAADSNSALPFSDGDAGEQSSDQQALTVMRHTPVGDMPDECVHEVPLVPGSRR